MAKYRFIRKDRASVQTGAEPFCYKYRGYDYGCSSDDTRFTGIEHIAVTMDPDGKGQFFTIPEEDLQEVPDAQQAGY